MPLYDYRCDRCGPFTAMRPMAAFRDPARCPACEADCARVTISAPAVAELTSAGTRRRSSSGSAAADGQARSHASGCGCCSPRWPRRFGA